MSQNNGGVPTENMFTNNDFETEVSLFYSVKYGDYNLENLIERVDNEDGLKTGYFPFASSKSGSFYLISLKEDDYGAIYLDHFDDSDLIKLTDSFEDFIDSLEEGEEEDFF